jgi:hypothetical protein
MGKHGKTWENITNVHLYLENTQPTHLGRENMGKHVKTWENILGKHNKCPFIP